MTPTIDFLTSDEHYGHTNVIEYANRPFAGAEEMTEELIRRHNSVVGTEHNVWHIGDFTLRPSLLPSVVPRLNGNHYLVRGNHDRSKHIDRYLAAGFSAVFEKVWLPCGDVTLVLQHIPAPWYYEGRDSRRPGEVIIHGHTHSKSKESAGHIHVGVDAWYYYPVPFCVIKAML